MRKIVVFTGAGVSAESGISTFRDSGGLWEQYNIEDVATPDAFRENPELVLDFYNQRRKNIQHVEPNEAHKAIVKLEEYFDVMVITQNIDDLHERAGSKNVLHLHGLITQARDEKDTSTLYEIGYNDIEIGDMSPKGGQLRPHIVWFGEDVPMMDKALWIVKDCAIFIVVGSSLNVYPAANLAHHAPVNSEKYIVDPHIQQLDVPNGFTSINDTAGQGVPKLVQQLIQKEKI